MIFKDQGESRSCNYIIKETVSKLQQGKVNTDELCYNKLLWTMEITSLYQNPVISGLKKKKAQRCGKSTSL